MSSEYGKIIIKGGDIVKLKYCERYRRIGLKVQYYRKLKGLTQEQLAERIDKSIAFLGSIEAPNIDKAMSLDMLFDIAEVLDIPPYKFLEDD